MRLINTTTLQVEEFIDQYVPPYAILSHMWGEEEVSFQEMQGCDEISTRKAGYKKIKQCCEIAMSDGFKHVWVDTCCIDKTSSSELSEAINSMYRWYLIADVCYVYLSDVQSTGDPKASESAFSRSRWFTRGWTLQELIAPSNLLFFSSDWKEIGSKSSLRKSIIATTGIHLRILLGGSVDKASVAQRMAWAANRKTTRAEDLAYCLMGLFNVHMPMIYGEGGDHAFLRLQEEILKLSDDQSIFAWTSSQCSGLLASSPAAFSHSDHIVAGSQTRDSKSITFSNKGINIELPTKKIALREKDVRSADSLCAVLDCYTSEDRTTKVGIELSLSSTVEGLFYRVPTTPLLPVRNSEAEELRKTRVYVEQSRSTIKAHICEQYLIRATTSLRENGFLFAGGGVYKWEEKALKWDKNAVKWGFGLRSGFCYHSLLPEGDELHLLSPNRTHLPSQIFGAAYFKYGQKDAFIVLLKTEEMSTSIDILVPLENETVEDIMRSYNRLDRQKSTTRKWKGGSDQLLWSLPMRVESILVKTRKQMVSGKSTNVITIDLVK
ncbi:heterokaryon incompatibility protein-domain-containing protein [Tricladium varicosporioides]|nr:heterokaryon incompatibility protein-domain-containing protein [Hymenoscyphus varicosporioides]